MTRGTALILNLMVVLALCLAFSVSADQGVNSDPMSSNDFLAGPIPAPDRRAVLPSGDEEMTRLQCMKCHPLITAMLVKAGAAHRQVPCRACHLRYHEFEPGKTDYSSILPECSRCHGQPHGEELTDCSSCHSEAHSPLEIPASLPLAQGCYVCHEALDKEIKTFATRHTELYCTACHHTKHGHIPECLECHQPHPGIFPARTRAQEPAAPRLLARCVSCHPPHSALKADIPNDTSNQVCSLCHREAYDVLVKSGTRHSRLRCLRCHPGKHRTIKRCRECHGEPHPTEMLRRAGSCGGCHGVAHSLVI
jgi:predicted CXXCH cytochrome family protein